MNDHSILDAYEVASLGNEATIVQRALRNLFSARKDELLRMISSMKPDGMEYAKISGRIQEWIDIEKTFELRKFEGEEAVQELKGRTENASRSYV